ncbi:MAG: hypothetical protein ACOYK8_09275 [Alphaproteobacteria bacterium]
MTGFLSADRDWFSKEAPIFAAAILEKWQKISTSLYNNGASSAMSDGLSARKNIERKNLRVIWASKGSNFFIEPEYSDLNKDLPVDIRGLYRQSFFAQKLGFFTESLIEQTVYDSQGLIFRINRKPGLPLAEQMKVLDTGRYIFVDEQPLDRDGAIALCELAYAHGWEEVGVMGDTLFCNRLWLEFDRFGMQISNFTPSTPLVILRSMEGQKLRDTGNYHASVNLEETVPLDLLIGALYKRQQFLQAEIAALQT